MLLLAISIAIIPVGCVPRTAEPEEEPQEPEKPVKGGKVVFAGIEPKTFNPILNTDRDGYYLLKLVYESLVDYDEHLKIKPVLAEKWEIRDNGNVYDFDLKKGIRWHDGEEFTSEDVIFTLEYLNSIKARDENSLYTKNLDRITYFEAVDDYRVRIVFDQRFNGALDVLTFPVIPAHLYDSPEKLAREGQEYKIVGTGPYKVKEYRKLKAIDLEVNPEWWGKEPYISEIEMRFVPDEATALTSFKADQVDVAVTSFTDWDRFVQGTSTYAEEFITNRYDFIGLNFENPIFKDRYLRRAIQYAIDRDRIIEKVYLKHAVKVDVPIPPYTWLYSKEEPAYQYSPDRAKEMLEKGGWMDRDDDGVLEKEIDGTKEDLSFTLMVNSDNPGRLEASRIIQENLEAIGIKVSLEEYTWEELTRRVFKRDFDAAVLGWHLAKYMDLSFAFHSSQIDGGSNFVSYNDKQMDDLLQQDFRAVHGDARKETSRKLQQYIREELPYISLYFKKAALLLKKRVKGNITPREHNIFLNINEWYIPEELQ